MIMPSIHSSVGCLIELPSNIKALITFLGHVINVFQHDCFALSLKVVSAIFYQIFIFSRNDSPLKTMKNNFYFI